MSYKIIITEIITETQTVGKEWKVVGQEQKKSSFSAEVFMSDEYGYTPEIEKPVTREVKRLEQEVEKIDMAAVIRAVNGL